MNRISLRQLLLINFRFLVLESCIWSIFQNHNFKFNKTEVAFIWTKVTDLNNICLRWLTWVPLYFLYFFNLNCIYRTVQIWTWKSSKLGSGRKAYFLFKLRRLFVLGLSRPESYLELVPSWDQDDLITKNIGRQRASESRMNFSHEKARYSLHMV